MDIKIKYFDKNMPKIKKVDSGDWIDLRIVGMKNPITKKYISKDIMNYHRGYHLLLDLGVAMELPEGYEAHIVPRSSTFKHWGFLQTNSTGIVDASYNGNNDKWFMSVYCTRNGKINKYDRVCQFKVEKKMPKINFDIVDKLENDNRGGHGSTGKN